MRTFKCGIIDRRDRDRLRDIPIGRRKGEAIRTSAELCTSINGDRHIGSGLPV